MSYLLSSPTPGVSALGLVAASYIFDHSLMIFKCNFAMLVPRQCPEIFNGNYWRLPEATLTQLRQAAGVRPSCLENAIHDGLRPRPIQFPLLGPPAELLGRGRYLNSFMHS